MDLMKWTDDLPEGFHNTVTHLWIQFEDGRVETCLKYHYSECGELLDDDEPQYSIHADCWGECVWDNEHRGYYSDEHGLITCHGNVNADLTKRLARKFKNAIYIRT